MQRATVTWFLALLWLGFWFFVILTAPTAHAEHLTEPDLALFVARVSANEGSFVSRKEAALVWQTTRSSAKTDAKRFEWLGRHSPRVGGTQVCKSGNCFWTPNLSRAGFLPVGLDIKQDMWDRRVAPLWLDTLRYVDWMVQGGRKSEDPCPVTPTTWGGPMDRRGALTRGLIPIGCRGTLNDGYTYAKHCWSAGSWLCDPSVEPAVVSEPSIFDMSLALAP